jgi:hypothetical protein
MPVNRGLLTVIHRLFGGMVSCPLGDLAFVRTGLAAMRGGAAPEGAVLPKYRWFGLVAGRGTGFSGARCPWCARRPEGAAHGPGGEVGG